MNKIYFFLVFYCIVACSTVPDFEVPQPAKKLCMASFISPDSILVHLYQNNYILANNNEKVDIFDSTAVINIFENGKYLCKLYPKRINDYLYFTSNIKISEGNKYSIKAEVIGYPVISSQTYVPNVIPIISIDTLNYYIDGFPYTLCTINFQDPPERDDFYYLEVRSRFKGVNYFSNLKFSSNDPIIDEQIEFGSHQLIFSDKEIQGSKYGVKISVESYYFHWSDLQIVLSSISKDFYLHFKSYVHFDKAKKDEFSEPVLIYTNIKDGLGIFAGYSTSIAMFRGDSIGYK